MNKVILRSLSPSAPPSCCGELSRLRQLTLILIHFFSSAADGVELSLRLLQ